METDERTYPRPITTIDLAIFALAEDGLEVLTVLRPAEPFAGHWALPGGWIHVDEDLDLDAAARRILASKTGVRTPYLEQLQTFGTSARDPRGWTVSVAYVALLSEDDARECKRVSQTDVLWRAVAADAVETPLAFDHADILTAALSRVRSKVEYSTLPVHLLPRAFTLGELQSVYERILGRKLDKSAFRKRVSEVNFVEPIVGEMRRASNRPAQLFRIRAGQATAFFDRTI
jgi:ADP-ribose pyrophosphatase YjhB (NUDIX family)